MSAIEMRVNMDCAGCENKIKKALKKVEGVDDVDVDMDLQKVTVMGSADQEKVLKAVRKTGRTVEMWPYTTLISPMTITTNTIISNPSLPKPPQPVSYYYAPGKSETFNTYNYENQQHYFNYNYEEDSYGYYQRPPPYSTVVDEQASSMFSDDNPNACSIM